MSKNTSLQGNDWVFQHEWLKKLDIKRIDENGKREYVTPIGNLPSVTTALSLLTKKHIDEWKNNVGEERANEISGRASRNGTAVHNVIEKFMKNDDSWRKTMPIAYSRAKPLLPILQKHVTKIYGIEYPLYSKELSVAGTSDIICQWDGINTIVDIKTSRSRKKKSRIKNYFAQCTAYAIMCKEIYGIEFPQIAVLITVNEDIPQLFIEQTTTWEHSTRLFFSGYKKGKFS